MKAIHVSPGEIPAPARLARRRVSEVMSSPAVTVADTTRLEEALTKMIRTGLRHLVVTSGDGRCAGILSDRAIAAAWASDFAVLTRDSVRVALEPQPAVVPVSGTVMDVARLMRATGVDAVAVVDEHGIAAGVITGSDLVTLLAS
jgi:signal-transduction protein with cAMP-binding, CBS, and nucleotidyltransferase domain